MSVEEKKAVVEEEIETQEELIAQIKRAIVGKAKSQPMAGLLAGYEWTESHRATSETGEKILWFDLDEPITDGEEVYLFFTECKTAATTGNISYQLKFNHSEAVSSVYVIPFGVNTQYSHYGNCMFDIKARFDDEERRGTLLISRVPIATTYVMNPYSSNNWSSTMYGYVMTGAYDGGVFAGQGEISSIGVYGGSTTNLMLSAALSVFRRSKA